MPKNIIVYHTSCSDGLTAAAVFNHKLAGQSNTFVAADYGIDSLSKVKWEGDVYIVDYCYLPSELEQIAAAVFPNKVVVLDHHATALDSLKNWTPPVNCTIVLDMTKSGCRIAWDWCFPDEPVPPMVKYVEDRDLWRYAYPETNYFCSWLDSQGYSTSHFFNIFSEELLNEEKVSEALLDGKAMYSKFMQSCIAIAKDAYPIEIDGIWGLAVCTSNEFHSLVGNLLATASGTFGLCWYLRPDGLVKCGIRSNGFNVKEIAEKFGGGGHISSSAFKGGLPLLMQLYSRNLVSSAPSEPLESDVVTVYPKIITVANVIITKLSATEYEGTSEAVFDFFITNNGSEFSVDIFDAKISDPNEAHCYSTVEPTLEEAVGTAYTWRK